MYDFQDLYSRYANHKPELLQMRGASAVLVPLIEIDGALHILYEVRSQDVSQPGEVCFPGGRVEPGETHVECALRETWEEIGIPAEAIEIIGELDYIYVRGDRLLFPILAKVDPSALDDLHACETEVAETFLLPVSWLMDNPPTLHRIRQELTITDFPYDEVQVSSDYNWRPYTFEVPIYHGLPHPLWGMTARITYYLLQGLRK